MARKSRAHCPQPALLRRWLRFEPLEERSLPSFVTAPSFTVGVNIGGLVPQGSATVSVAVGDFNGDGKKDVATANESGPGVSVRLGKGTGQFSPCTNFAVGNDPVYILAAD